MENGNCGKWKLWKMKIVENGNCKKKMRIVEKLKLRKCKLLKMEIVENGNCGNWNLWKMEIVEILVTCYLLLVTTLFLLFTNSNISLL